MDIYNNPSTSGFKRSEKSLIPVSKTVVINRKEQNMIQSTTAAAAKPLASQKVNFNIRFTDGLTLPTHQSNETKRRTRPLLLSEKFTNLSLTNTPTNPTTRSTTIIKNLLDWQKDDTSSLSNENNNKNKMDDFLKQCEQNFQLDASIEPKSTNPIQSSLFDLITKNINQNTRHSKFSTHCEKLLKNSKFYANSNE